MTGSGDRYRQLDLRDQGDRLDRAAVPSRRGARPSASPIRNRDISEQNPDDWWDAAAAALRSITDQVDAGRIAAVAISISARPSARSPNDEAAIRPGMTWLDERARPRWFRFGQSFGAERVHAISGKPLDVLPCLYRIIWMAEQEPRFCARGAVRRGPRLSTHCLTGQWRTSTASADPTGLLDMTSGAWSQPSSMPRALRSRNCPRWPGPAPGWERSRTRRPLSPACRRARPSSPAVVTASAPAPAPA